MKTFFILVVVITTFVCAGAFAMPMGKYTVNFTLIEGPKDQFFVEAHIVFLDDVNHVTRPMGAIQLDPTDQQSVSSQLKREAVPEAIKQLVVLFSNARAVTVRSPGLSVKTLFFKRLSNALHAFVDPSLHDSVILDEQFHDPLRLLNRHSISISASDISKISYSFTLYRLPGE